MSKKWKIIAVVIGMLVAYGTWHRLTLEPIPIGQLCDGSGGCVGTCLGFGDLLPDYSHKELCTQECESNADCPSPTACAPVTVYTTNRKGTETAKKHYCLPANTPQ